MPARTGKKKSSSTTGLRVNVVLLLNKSTKGTHVYTSNEEDAPIPSLYIRKSAFKGAPPDGIIVTCVAGTSTDSDDDDREDDE